MAFLVTWKSLLSSRVVAPEAAAADEVPSDKELIAEELLAIVPCWEGVTAAAAAEDIEDDGRGGNEVEDDVDVVACRIE